jgi:fermentation-respiration switch protein FrsA (DUF1100 family)
MKGHCILSHGLDSSPEATKVSAMAQVAEAMGWTTERPDYRDIDATRDIREVANRQQRLVMAARKAPQPLVLAGSSMGRLHFRARDAGGRLHRPVPDGAADRVAGLSDHACGTQLIPTTVIHGWHDELIPAADVMLWSKMRSDHLILVDDEHRLAAHVDFVAQEFGRFLARLE